MRDTIIEIINKEKDKINMKEQIYTIPVNEAYDTDCECPLCFLEEKLEKESVDYEMGAAMMEADHREESDKKGFCNKHFSMMFKKQNRLSLALVLDTHMEAIRKELEKNKKIAAASGKGGLFKKDKSAEAAQNISECINSIECGCMVCEKVDYTMSRYIDVMLYMWANDEKFREKFDSSKGMCLKHMGMVTRVMGKSLKGEKGAKFLEAMYEKQLCELERIQKDIHKFTLKFDYRNKDMEWGTAYDAPIRTIEKIAGYIEKEESKS